MIANDTLWMACVAGYNGNNIFGTENEWLCLGAQLWTGTNDHSGIAKNNSLIVYPNPVNDKLVVRSSELGVKAVEVYNTLGEKIMTVQLTATNYQLRTELNVSSLAPGVYSIRTSGDNGVSNVKFVKQ